MWIATSSTVQEQLQSLYRSAVEFSVSQTSSKVLPIKKLPFGTQDDGSGRQQWTIATATGAAGAGYTITILNGRGGCETFFGGNTCANGNAPLFYNSNDGSGLQVWSITAPGPPPPPVAPQLFPNGQYQLIDAGRSACASSLAAATCTQGNAVGLASNNGKKSFWCTCACTSPP